MVSKVTLSLLVLCLCLSQSLQAPDHNRTRRADEKPTIPGVPASPFNNIQDFQGFMNVIANWIPGAKKDKDKVPEQPPAPTPARD